jgi:hypothetical protein
MPEASKYQCAIAPIGVQRFAIFIIACFLPSPRAKPAQPASSFPGRLETAMAELCILRRRTVFCMSHTGLVVSPEIIPNANEPTQEQAHKRPTGER